MSRALSYLLAAGCSLSCSGPAAAPARSAEASTGCGVAETGSGGLKPVSASTGYVETPNRYLESGGRRLAYRSVGAGPPLVLCNRFRGVLDSWDPAFIDALAQRRTVITFDYSGLGSSTGQPPNSMQTMSQDVKDLTDGLGYTQVDLGGWSLGGFVAQTASARFPGLVQHLILIGTGPAGANEHPPEAIFFERASKPVNDLDDEIVLFFEPLAEGSRRAAKASHERIAKRTHDSSPPVPPELWAGLHAAGAEFRADKLGTREWLKRTGTPILVISGDHDIVFPVENWYALNRQLPTTQLLVFPRSGHGPQHEYIAESASAIAAFLAE
jgi:pimeloyl-ACP methyl ester carboxylesterase